LRYRSDVLLIHQLSLMSNLEIFRLAQAGGEIGRNGETGVVDHDKLFSSEKTNVDVVGLLSNVRRGA
jgi:hypothetical protein